MVGVYKGATPNGETETPWWKKCAGLGDDSSARLECHSKYAGQRTTRTIEVETHRSDVPAVLVLMSYEPVKWKVSVKPENKIVKIILSGYHGQDIEGAPDNIPVEVRSYEASPCRNCARQPDYFYAYKQDSPEYENAVKKLKAITGLSPTSFQGSHQASRFSIGNQATSNLTSSSKSSNDDLDAFTKKTYRDQIRVAGYSVSLPEGVWTGLAYTTGPSKRGKDILVALGRKSSNQFSDIIAIRVQTVDDGNGFPQFAGCKNDPHYAGQVTANQSFGNQLCFEVAHITDAWSQPLLAMAKTQLNTLGRYPADTVVASSFHRSDMTQSIDMLVYALPDTQLVNQGEQWESSPWHPKHLKPNSEETNFVQDQVKWATTWHQLFSLSIGN